MRGRRQALASGGNQATRLHSHKIDTTTVIIPVHRKNRRKGTRFLRARRRSRDLAQAKQFQAVRRKDAHFVLAIIGSPPRLRNWRPGTVHAGGAFQDECPLRDRPGQHDGVLNLNWGDSYCHTSRLSKMTLAAGCDPCSCCPTPELTERITSSI